MVFFLSLTLSLDALIIALTYRQARIKIPLLSLAAIALTTASTFAITFVLAANGKTIISPFLSRLIGALFLLLIGLIKLIGGLIKRKKREPVSGIRQFFEVLMWPTTADSDRSQQLSLMESWVLALSLSGDGIAIAFALALSGSALSEALIVALLLFVFSFSFLLLGQKGRPSRLIDLNWVSGLILILLALLRFF